MVIACFLFDIEVPRPDADFLAGVMLELEKQARQRLVNELMNCYKENKFDIQSFQLF